MIDRQHLAFLLTHLCVKMKALIRKRVQMKRLGASGRAVQRRMGKHENSLMKKKGT